MDKKKRTVVVTGGSRGIGRAICVALAEPGVSTYFNFFSPSDPDAELAEAAKTEKLVAEAGGVAKGSSVNVASESEVADFFETIINDTGQIDVLVNNAGITRDGFLIKMKEQDWDAVMGVNLKGTFNCSKIAAKTMMKQRSGSIINIASVVGVIGNIGQANYVASKAGVIGLTKSLAKEFAQRGIRVNAIAPGFIETDMTKSLSEKAKNAFLTRIPMGKAGKPEDIAMVVAFLASESAAYITGQTIHVSGGMYI